MTTPRVYNTLRNGDKTKTKGSVQLKHLLIMLIMQTLIKIAAIALINSESSLQAYPRVIKPEKIT